MAKSEAMKRKETEEAAQWFRDRMWYEIETGLLWWRNNKLVSSKMRGKSAGRKQVSADGYAWRSVKRTVNKKQDSYQYHRIVWMLHFGEWPDGYIDHIDGDAAGNNRAGNLRIASNSENARNMRIAKNNTSGITGVSWDKAIGKWQSNINVNNRMVNLGRFDEVTDAVAARKAAEKKYGFHPNHGRAR